MGKFLQREAESFNCLSTRFFTFYTQYHWGIFVQLYSCCFIMGSNAAVLQNDFSEMFILASLMGKCQISLYPKIRMGEIKHTRLRAVAGF